MIVGDLQPLEFRLSWLGGVGYNFGKPPSLAPVIVSIQQQSHFRNNFFKFTLISHILSIQTNFTKFQPNYAKYTKMMSRFFIKKIKLWVSMASSIMIFYMLFLKIYIIIKFDLVKWVD